MEKNDRQQLYAAVCRVRKSTNGFRHLIDLTPGEFMVFNHVMCMQSQKGARASELSQHLKISRPGISHLLRNLERKGLIERRTSMEDRRAVYVHITDNGREFYRSMISSISKYMDHVVEKMGHQKIEQLTVLLNELADAVNAVAKLQAV